MKTKTLKTSELDGRTLDWVVDYLEHLEFLSEVLEAGAGDWASFLAPLYSALKDAPDEYSTDWYYGGPIIEREGISTNMCPDGSTWFAVSGYSTKHAETPLLAAMRCYVARELGEEVEVPVVLLE